MSSLRRRALTLAEAAMVTKETLDDIIRQMGSRELGMLYAMLIAKAAHLHIKWAEYQELYHQTPKRIEFLNQVAPSFFASFQEEGRESIILHIARLTDVAKSGGGGKHNLSLQALPAA